MIYSLIDHITSPHCHQCASRRWL